LFTPPEESEFLSRGFEQSPLHDPDEAIVSYCRSYQSNQVLTVTFTLGIETNVQVSLSHDAVPCTAVEIESLESVAFQSWHGERTLRFSFSVPQGTTDLRVHYEPAPSVHVSVLA